MRIDVVDMHTAGEPARIITGGYPRLTAPTIMGKRREAKEKHDDIRRALMLEPRGHDAMYGVILTEASHPEAAAGVLFTHGEGYSTMCGHAAIALGKFLVDRGYVEKAEPVTRLAIEAPCGLVRLAVEVKGGKAGRVSFESVPAFVERLDFSVPSGPHRGTRVDIAYGGAFYAILPASRLGLDFFETPVEALKAAAAAITDAIRAAAKIRHTHEPDLGFLYGTILTDDAPPESTSFNLCVFAERQIDRSPTGSGVTARLALDHAKGLIREGVMREFRGISGEAFKGMVLRSEAEGAIIEVAGEGFYTGEASFTLDDADPLGRGFSLAKRFGDLR